MPEILSLTAEPREGAGKGAARAVRLTHNVRQLTIAPLMAEAILRISEERSVSSLFG